MKDKTNAKRQRRYLAARKAKGLERVHGLFAYPEDKPKLKAIAKQMIEDRERDNDCLRPSDQASIL